MGDQRATFDFDDESEGFDLSSLVSSHKKTAKQHYDAKALNQVAEASGFVSREPRRRKAKRRSPFTIQSNLKTRPGMKDLMQEVGDRLGTYDQETFELALEALLEKHGMTDLQREFEQLVQRDSYPDG